MQGNTMESVRPAEFACPGCGGDRFEVWEVPAGGGWAPKLVPLPFFEGARCQLRCCLACGLIQWFATPDTLVSLRQKGDAA